MINNDEYQQNFEGTSKSKQKKSSSQKKQHEIAKIGVDSKLFNENLLDFDNSGKKRSSTQQV